MKIRRVNVLNFLVLSFLTTASSWAAHKGPLFSKGNEAFKIIDSSTGQTPHYKLFHDSVTKKAVALSLNTLLDLKSKDKTAVDVRLEGMIFKSSHKNPQQATLTLLVSGKDFELESRVSKSDLQSGKSIEIKIKIKNQSDQVGPATLQSRGNFTLRFQADQDILYIDRGWAKFSFDDLLGEEQSEELKLSAKGLRL